MATPPNTKLRYRRSGPPGVSRYEVVHEGLIVGTVGRYQPSAGQFGSSWVATTPRRKRSGSYRTRDAAGAWLLRQAG
jgi:hypothetical protein